MNDVSYHFITHTYLWMMLGYFDLSVPMQYILPMQHIIGLVFAVLLVVLFCEFLRKRSSVTIPPPRAEAVFLVLLAALPVLVHKVCIAPVDGVCSTDILVLRPVALWMPFVLCHVSSKTLIEYATRLSNGAKMPRTKWQDLYSYPIAVPSERLAEKFADVIRPIVLKGRSSS
jgi:hypothetical protein